MAATTRLRSAASACARLAASSRAASSDTRSATRISAARRSADIACKCGGRTLSAACVRACVLARGDDQQVSQVAASVGFQACVFKAWEKVKRRSRRCRQAHMGCGEQNAVHHVHQQRMSLHSGWKRWACHGTHKRKLKT
eukprot:1150770-Pelagomonas_calceolata.AAC.2